MLTSCAVYIVFLAGMFYTNTTMDKGKYMKEFNDLLTDEQTEELTEKILSQSQKASSVEKTRKKTDYQWSEYIFAILLKNPHLDFDIKIADIIKWFLLT